ncbi:double-strand break repair protein AddB [Sphingorhabdus pulchriflava]|uniref:Double-strand break repair protein AddB n=1 Tax=Sphingorhabdus pulchriflava TaxID=2292257 RepID=A0A371BGP9_9SPHN|nr:double-strand break repair protein AddB [Sphingorhabdus pulchriflava]RDV06775.1 double-strand break repair protein AddB [Sphingorhabdus pulchriflava]
MAEHRSPNVFTVPIGTDISSAVALELTGRYRADRMALADILLLLPNNRAIAAMTSAFVRIAEQGLILPRMAAIGDLALDEALGPLLDPLGDGELIPPAIGDLERQLLLTRLVRNRRPQLSAAEALNLARLLMETVDQLEIEGVPVAKIETDHQSHDLAEHWQSAYADLLLLAEAYQSELSKLGLLNPAARRNMLLDRLASRLTQQSDNRSVWAVGISTAAPAIASLLRQVAVLPSGRVILPHVDLQMPAAEWDALGSLEKRDDGSDPPGQQETHPQYHLKLLLHRMNINRSEVSSLALNEPSAHGAEVQMAVADIFCAATQTVNWQELPASRKKLTNVRLMSCADSAEEAKVIAVLIREALETPARRVALVTPDREIALRVSAQLKRWDIDADDSAGVPLTQTPSGVLLLAITDMLAGQFDPVALLAVFKHPLVAAGDARLAWLENVRQLDQALRGPRLGLGIAGIRDAMRAKFSRSEKDAALYGWWAETEKRLQSYDFDHMRSFADKVKAVAALASELSDGAIWKGPAGRALADILTDIQSRDLSVFDDTKGAAVAVIVRDMISMQTIRPAFGTHPRVSIYGLLEARLQSADLLICAGLNEGSWPQLPQPDPWLAPRLRRDLGLPGLERNIGLSAHDLASALGATEVVLTRAQRDRSGPTIASRFLLRLQAFLGPNLQIEERARHFANQLDAPQIKHKPYARPVPSPSREQRKVDISITQMDVLKADPFAFYARNILGLSPLKAVAAEPDSAWKGSAVHDLLQLWAEEDDCDPDALTARAKAMLANPALHPALRMLWQPRISAALSWIASETLRQRVEDKRTIAVTEKKGRVEIDNILVHGRIDRVDRQEDGRLVIVDYKTGSPPPKKRVRVGYALQLGLAGLMAETGGIEGADGEVANYEYWSLSRSKRKGTDIPFGYSETPFTKKTNEDEPNADKFAAFAETQARQAISRWITGNDPFTAKLKPEYAPYKDYDQLMRLAEWMGNTDWKDDDDVV